MAMPCFGFGPACSTLFCRVKCLDLPVLVSIPGSRVWTLDLPILVSIPGFRVWTCLFSSRLSVFRVWTCLFSSLLPCLGSHSPLVNIRFRSLQKALKSLLMLYRDTREDDPADCWIWGEKGLKEYKWKGIILGYFVGLVVPVQEIFAPSALAALAANYK